MRSLSGLSASPASSQASCRLVAAAARVLAGVAVVVLVAPLVGCSTMNDLKYTMTQKHRTCSAWKCYQANSSCDFGCDYECGWKAGYYDVLTGGCGEPPVVAPKKYWEPGRIIAECDKGRHRWYVGFQDGAAAAKRCPDTHYLKLWMPPASCKPAFQACPVGPGPQPGADASREPFQAVPSLLPPSESPDDLPEPEELDEPEEEDTADDADDTPAPPGEDNALKLPPAETTAPAVADEAKPQPKPEPKRESFAERLRKMAAPDEPAETDPSDPVEDAPEAPQNDTERVPPLNPLIPPQSAAPVPQPKAFALSLSPSDRGGKRTVTARGSRFSPQPVAETPAVEEPAVEMPAIEMPKAEMPVAVEEPLQAFGRETVETTPAPAAAAPRAFELSVTANRGAKSSRPKAAPVARQPVARQQPVAQPQPVAKPQPVAEPTAELVFSLDGSAAAPNGGAKTNGPRREPTPRPAVAPTFSLGTPEDGGGKATIRPVSF